LLGLIPLLINLSQVRLVPVLGAGLLCGTALAIIIPEGNSYPLFTDSYCSAATAKQNSTNSNSTLEPSSEKVGVKACFLHWKGLFFASLSSTADGVALGAAVASSQVSVQVIVFFAVILHKAPAAFGLVSFLMYAGLERSTVQKHLLGFSMAAPLLAVSTYFLLSTGGSSQYRLSATGIGMLVSAGTFLYVATVHVLPEIYSRGQQRTTHFHHHAGVGLSQQGGLGLMESVFLVTGAGLPVLLAFSLPDD
uniref:Zinc transporter ZIP9 n=1 Tax=Electrophorus electricus TaxID=8005 RepID=A0AAY5F3F9_ELEEL